jgi:hypothetical protein
MTTDSREKDIPKRGWDAAADETDTTDGLSTDQEDPDVGIRYWHDAMGVVNQQTRQVCSEVVPVDDVLR